jgi:hypothetical protein
MTPPDASRSPARDDQRRAPAKRARRTLEQIAQGVRRQREHIMMLDGSDPLRGGVAD